MNMYEEAQARPSAMDVLEETPHVDDSAFHYLYSENTAASAIMQGFARFMFREKTGEPELRYNMMHASLSAFELKVFLHAFGDPMESLPDDVSELWSRCVAKFGIAYPPPRAAEPEEEIPETAEEPVKKAAK